MPEMAGWMETSAIFNSVISFLPDLCVRVLSSGPPCLSANTDRTNTQHIVTTILICGAQDSSVG